MKSREAFEAWALTQYPPLYLGRGEEYSSTWTEGSWRGWQAAEQATRPQWQPIETAPRGSGEDGPGTVTHPDYIAPPRLLLATEEGLTVGYYDWYYHPGYGRGAEPGVPAWRSVDGESVFDPTHWMPLPDAPEQKT